VAELLLTEGPDCVAGMAIRCSDFFERTTCVFLDATTRASADTEDILPQDGDCSVFRVFSLLFPKTAGDQKSTTTLRLRFNRIAYTIYDKGQSRRVPSHRIKAKESAGYGFRLARWRSPLSNEEDRLHCEGVLRGIGCNVQFIDRAKAVVQDFHDKWEQERRTSRPAGPGRPPRQDRGNTCRAKPDSQGMSMCTSLRHTPLARSHDGVQHAR